MKNVCLYITVKSRWPGQYYMYISILIKINNHRIGFLFSPLCKEVQECGKLYRNLVEAKIQLWGPYTITRIFGTIHFPLYWDAERKRSFTAGGVCQITDLTLTICQVQILHRMQKEVLTQFLVPYFCCKLWIPNQRQRKDKEKKKIFSEVKPVFGSLETNDVQSKLWIITCVSRKGVGGRGRGQTRNGRRASKIVTNVASLTGFKFSALLECTGIPIVIVKLLGCFYFCLNSLGGVLSAALDTWG